VRPITLGVLALAVAACIVGPGLDRATWAPLACTVYRDLDAAAGGRIDTRLIDAATAAQRSLGGTRWVEGEDIRGALTETSREAVETIEAHQAGDHTRSEAAYAAVVDGLWRAYRAMDAAGLDCGGPPSLAVS
jgi:hypothetical protein